MELKPIVSYPRRVPGLLTSGVDDWLARLLASNRFALSIALVLAVLVPMLLHPDLVGFVAQFPYLTPGIEPSVIGSCAAIIAGHLSLRKMGVLPLVSTGAMIIPTFLATYGAVALVLFSFHMQFGRYYLWTSLGIALGWYLVLSGLRARYLRPTIGLLGMGEGFPGKLGANVDWRVLNGPKLPGNVAAVVVDPHAELTLANSRFITQLVLAGIPVYHRDHFEEGLTGKVRFHSHADNDFGALLPSLMYLRVKRLADLCAALLLLAPAVLVLAIAGLAIRLTSPGPVLFSQVRTGFRGRPFVCYKLRTMVAAHAGPAFTEVQDARVTPVGRILRKWRIDELPQIINVLRGDMSWIGPRPEAEVLAAHYAAHVAFYDYRHAVRPGISGWAAVHQGNVSEVEAAQEKLEYDFYYIKYFSVWLDMLIFFKTIRTIWNGFGSR